MISLAYPWVLLLALLPLLLANRKQQDEQVDAPVNPVGHWLSGMPGVSSRGRSTPLWGQLLLFLGWVCLVVALARTEHVGEEIQMPVTGQDVMLVVDISPSMDEQDM